ncbi:MAG: DNA gyrase subunit A [Chloroflexi bacterium]|nr:DNA gyrase subunit A [Chloroflexota bacterium]
MAELGTVKIVSIDSEMRSAYLDYAMSVIVQRALPDVRDGLKPVQRRILYAMHDEGLRPGTSYRKSAGAVGEVLKKYHPHGEAAVYDALVRMVQDFVMRYPLVDGQGNFGSMDGDSAAAMRYTESRLAPIAEELLADIDKETVDFRPNYDDREHEPSVLPARLPNLLLNGVSGIAVGMATNIPPHNLTELCQGISHLIDHPEATVEELAEIITGPDFPTGGLILGREGILQAYATGKGRVILRAKAYTEEGRANRYQIVVTEVPYMVNKASLLEKIAALVKEGRLDGISDLRDESDRSGVRVVIELKRDAQPVKVLNNLYKHTPLQITFGVNMLALVDGRQPRVLTLKMVLHHYIEHRQQVLTRRTQYELKRARQRAHILEGLRIALDNLDAVIATIRNSRTTESARNNLIAAYKLSTEQANAILDLQLRRLAALERRKIEDEYKELLREIRRLEGILADPKQVLALIKQDMASLIEKYGDERRSRIVPDATGELTDADLIPDVGTLVTITERGYIKRLPVETYRAQGRGGRGVNGMSTRDEDKVQHILSCTTMDNLLFFTNRGRVFVLKAHELPDASRTAKGMPVINFIAIQPDERVTTVLAVSDFDAAQYLVMCTRGGTIKRTVLSAYAAVRANGLIAINLDSGDELLWVRLTTGRDQIIISTRGGMAIRFTESDVRPMGRTAAGVIAIKLAAGDQVAAMDVVDLKKDLLVVSELGYGKRTPLTDYRLQGRAGSGVITMKLTDKTGRIVSARVVDDSDHLMLISAKGTVIRIDLANVRRIGRGTQGVRLQRLADGARVASVEPIDATEAIDNGAIVDAVPAPAD